MPTVLVIADDPYLVDLASYNLQAAGFAVDPASDGAAALAALADHGLDLLLVGWKVPGMTGLEVCRQARWTCRRLPIAVLAHSAGELERMAAQCAGADTVIVKPYSPRALVTAVATLLSERQIPAPTLRDHHTSIARTGRLPLTPPDALGRRQSRAA
jgi:two-component system phosphate regulon response regulator PhoB